MQYRTLAWWQNAVTEETTLADLAAVLKAELIFVRALSPRDGHWHAEVTVGDPMASVLLVKHHRSRAGTMALALAHACADAHEYERKFVHGE